jgi:hypothetical protein
MTTMKDHFPEKISPQVQKQFEEMFAMWTYQKGLSFCLWDESFQKIISFLRPGVTTVDFQAQIDYEVLCLQSHM